MHYCALKSMHIAQGVHPGQACWLISIVDISNSCRVNIVLLAVSLCDSCDSYILGEWVGDRTEYTVQ
jgi:hypothetical protein